MNEGRRKERKKEGVVVMIQELAESEFKDVSCQPRPLTSKKARNRMALESIETTVRTISRRSNVDCLTKIRNCRT